MEYDFNSIHLLESIRLFHFFNKDYLWTRTIGFVKTVGFTECLVKDATDLQLKSLSIQRGEWAYALRRNGHCGTRVLGTKDLFSLERFRGLKYWRQTRVLCESFIQQFSWREPFVLDHCHGFTSHQYTCLVGGIEPRKSEVHQMSSECLGAQVWAQTVTVMTVIKVTFYQNTFAVSSIRILCFRVLNSIWSLSMKIF
jgi:hypothetical protein